MSKFGDMYKDYISAGEGAEVVEFDFGFLVLKNVNNLLYIETIYVAPEFRKQNKGSEMLDYAEKRAKNEQKVGILGSCCPSRKGATVSMKSMFARGFEIESASQDVIYLIKPIGGV